MSKMVIKEHSEKRGCFLAFHGFSMKHTPASEEIANICTIVLAVVQFIHIIRKLYRLMNLQQDISI